MMEESKNKRIKRYGPSEKLWVKIKIGKVNAKKEAINGTLTKLQDLIRQTLKEIKHE